MATLTSSLQSRQLSKMFHVDSQHKAVKNRNGYPEFPLKVRQKPLAREAQSNKRVCDDCDILGSSSKVAGWRGCKSTPRRSVSLEMRFPEIWIAMEEPQIMEQYAKEKKRSRNAGTQRGESE